MELKSHPGRDPIIGLKSCPGRDPDEEPLLGLKSCPGRDPDEEPLLGLKSCPGRGAVIWVKISSRTRPGQGAVIGLKSRPEITVLSPFYPTPGLMYLISFFRNIVIFLALLLPYLFCFVFLMNQRKQNQIKILT